jgi:hypothetical protein
MRLCDLPLFDVLVFVDMRPGRYRCPYGPSWPTTTPLCAWCEPCRPNTKAYEPWALRLLINATIADVAHKLGVSEETIDCILDRWIARAVDWGPGSGWGDRQRRDRALARAPRCCGRGQGGRFGNGLGISRRPSGSGSSGSSLPYEARGCLPPAGRPDGIVRARRYDSGGHVRASGLVPAGACMWAGRVQQPPWEARSVEGRAHARLPGSADERACRGVQHPREGAQETVLWALQGRQALPTAHARPQWISTLWSHPDMDSL